MLDFFGFVDGPLVEHRSICVDERTEMKEWEKRNIRCSKCHKRYTIIRPSIGTKKLCICPDCGHSFEYIEGSQ